MIEPFIIALNEGHVNILKNIEKRINISAWANYIFNDTSVGSIAALNYVLRKGYGHLLTLYKTVVNLGHYEMLKSIITSLNVHQLESCQLEITKANRVDMLYLIRSFKPVKFYVESLEHAASHGNVGMFRLILENMCDQVIPREVLSNYGLPRAIGETSSEEIFNTVFDAIDKLDSNLIDDEDDDEYELYAVSGPILKENMAISAMSSGKNFNNVLKSFKYAEPVLRNRLVIHKLLRDIIMRDSDNRILDLLAPYYTEDTYFLLNVIEMAIKEGRMGKYEKLFSMMNKRKDTEIYNKILIYAARKGNFKIIREMLELGADDLCQAFANSGNLDVAIFLEGERKTDFPVSCYEKIVTNSLVSGNLSLVKYYYEKSGLKPEDLGEIQMGSEARRFVFRGNN
jgi:hypothetical protein